MESPIEQLSEDILLEIFEYLDGNSLKKAALVCRTWNDVIGLSSSTMRKFSLKISNMAFAGNPNWQEEVLSLERNFQAIDVTLYNLGEENSAADLVEILNQHGSQVRQFSLKNVTFQPDQVLNDILSKIPLVEEIEFCEVVFSSGIQQTISPVILPKLRILKVVKSSWKVFQHLMGSQIQELKTMTTVTVRNERKYLVDFLKASKKLKSIVTDFIAFNIVFDQPVNKLQFKLEKFKYFSYQDDYEDAADNFSDFLISQASSLKVLQLNMASRKVVKTILGKLKCLKKLRIHSGSLSDNEEFYDSFLPVKSMTAVEAHDALSNEESAKAFFKLFPNLEAVKIDHDPNHVLPSLLKHFSENNQKLKSISIEKLPDDVLKFRTLTFLHICKVESFQKLLMTVKDNPSISTLSIGHTCAEVFTDSALDTLMEQTSLEHLKFVGKHDITEAMKKKIESDPKWMKSLELFQKINGARGWKNMKISFDSVSIL